MGRRQSSEGRKEEAPGGALSRKTAVGQTVGAMQGVMRVETGAGGGGKGGVEQRRHLPEGASGKLRPEG